MTLCVGTGYISENGPCTFMDMVDTHGVVLTTCADIVYTPAACPDAPDEGVIDYGPGYVKIASVDGTVPDVCVQRDASGYAYAVAFEVNVGDCTDAEKATRVHVSDVTVGPITYDANATHLRLRGKGDTAAYGGTTPDNQIGVFDLQRTPDTNGIVLYRNYGSPVASAGGHFFQLSSLDPLGLQNLMWLEASGGTLWFPAWTYISDESAKTNVADLAENAAITAIKGLAPKTYTYQGSDFTGFSAQNVQTYLPDAVATKTIDDFNELGAPIQRNVLTIRDGDILSAVVAALKNVIDRVETLEA